MGTNYYVEEQPPCPHCGRPYDTLHIGKSSAGWCFSLHVDTELGLTDLPAWETYWQGKQIRNEYGKPISPQEMRQIITARQGHGFPDGWAQRSGYASEEQFHAQNGSSRGPNGLLRHQLSRHCVGHGDGTWDLIEGEFS